MTRPAPNLRRGLRAQAHHRTAPVAVAAANAESLALLEAIAAALPDAGDRANWGHAGSAAHVRDRLREIAEHLGVTL